MHTQGLKASSMIYGSTTPLQSLSELSDMGYQLVFRPLSGTVPRLLSSSIVQNVIGNHKQHMSVQRPSQ